MKLMQPVSRLANKKSPPNVSLIPGRRHDVSPANSNSNSLLDQRAKALQSAYYM